jgi:hypothetical protein
MSYDTRKLLACYALSSLRWGNHVRSVNFPGSPPATIILCFACLPTWDEVTVVQYLQY